MILVKVPILLDNLACLGNELSIFDCQGKLNDHNCNHDEDIGVKCLMEGIL